MAAAASGIGLFVLTVLLLLLLLQPLNVSAKCESFISCEGDGKGCPTEFPVCNSCRAGHYCGKCSSDIQCYKRGGVCSKDGTCIKKVRKDPPPRVNNQTPPKSRKSDHEAHADSSDDDFQLCNIVNCDSALARWAIKNHGFLDLTFLFLLASTSLTWVGVPIAVVYFAARFDSLAEASTVLLVKWTMCQLLNCRNGPIDAACAFVQAVLVVFCTSYLGRIVAWSLSELRGHDGPKLIPRALSVVQLYALFSQACANKDLHDTLISITPHLTDFGHAAVAAQIALLWLATFGLHYSVFSVYWRCYEVLPGAAGLALCIYGYSFFMSETLKHP